MKYPIILILISILFIGCDKPQSVVDTPATPEVFADADPAKFPALVIDEVHRLEGTNVVAYELPAADGLRVDVSKCHFTFGRTNSIPNMIMLAMDKEHVFELAQAVETNVYVIDRKTLKQIKERGFPGFRPGEHWLLTIGREETGEGALSVLVSWEGRIEVK
jgi:hypothetical protein